MCIRDSLISILGTALLRWLNGEVTTANQASLIEEFKRGNGILLPIMLEMCIRDRFRSPGRSDFRPVREYVLCPSWSSNLWWDGLHASTKQDQKIRSYQSLGNRDGRIFLLIWPFLCGFLARLDFWISS